MAKLNLSIEQLTDLNEKMRKAKADIMTCTDILTDGLKQDIFESSGESLRLKLKKNKAELETNFTPNVKKLISNMDNVIMLTAEAIKEAQK